MMKRVEFKNNKGQKLRGFVHVPKKSNGIAIVALHGFPGEMNSKRLRRTGSISQN
jgi:hypothetical protein